MKEIRKTRNMKVYSQSGYKYREIPSIRLQGNWLKDAGFDIGDYISVTCEDGRLVITPDAERAKLAEAEAAFMEKEMKALRKRFDEEKKKLQLQFVAEQNAEYGKGAAYV